MQATLDFLVHSPVEHHARLAPERPALAMTGETMSYGELDRGSNRFARTLRTHGLMPSDRVGIFMHKSLELGIAIYGSLKAGGVFVPLDPFMPAERLAFILDDCDIDHLVSSDRLAEVVGSLEGRPGLHVYGVDGDVGRPGASWEAMSGESDAPLDLPLIDEDLAYLMYTSGSTGVPKGMMHTHRGSVSYARWGALYTRLTPEDHVASHAPLHFDLSIFDFFSTAQAGGTVVLVPEPVTKFPASWTAYIESESISVVFTVPFTLIEMLHRGAMETKDLSSLRWVLFGGEPFPPKHLRALMRKLPKVTFTNVYGPAEAPSCTVYDVPPPADGDDDDEMLPIGTVSHNSTDLVVDEADRPCGIDEEGELCIRSSTLMRGYWNRPDLNEKAFLLQDSFGPFPRVWYRTGDVVVRKADGLLRFLGRKDRMVKVRGNRVELDEVEAALTSHASVSEAAAFAIADGRGSNTVRAAVTLHEGASAIPAELRQHARERIPAYAVPETIVVSADLPRTTSGKIDRRRLADDAA